MTLQLSLSLNLVVNSNLIMLKCSGIRDYKSNIKGLSDFAIPRTSFVWSLLFFFPSKPILGDMFAGVGPFAIPLARKGVRTFANDLNPNSYSWLLKNAKKNLSKRKFEYLSCYCLDAREFIRNIFLKQKISVTQILMNLPKLAPEFCDVFIGLIPKDIPLPRVHVYCFSSGATFEIMQLDAISRIESSMGGVKLEKDDLKIFKIRQTSTNTLEFCISFTIPAQVGYKKI